MTVAYMRRVYTSALCGVWCDLLWLGKSYEMRVCVPRFRRDIASVCHERSGSGPIALGHSWLRL